MSKTTGLSININLPIRLSPAKIITEWTDSSKTTS